MSLLISLVLALVFPFSIPAEKMEAKRLPDLNIPRAGHSLLYLNGELTVLGGHTTGFIPTPTAEYYRNGKWNTVSTLYPHDNGFCLPLKNGTVLLGGGLAESFGIGQTFSVERYIPETHSFEPVPILDRKRALASAAQLDDGTILVSGNWYAQDALEFFSDTQTFEYVKETAEQRSLPWILPTAPDNALIFSSTDTRGSAGKGWVDRYQGDPFQVPLLTSARPLTPDSYRQPCEIGNPAQEDYDYLLLAVNDKLQASGILRIHGEDFSLLELETAIPLDGPDGPIRYFHPLLKYGVFAWALGTDEAGRVYLLQIGYGPALKGGKATLKLYYTDPLEDIPQYGSCSMLPDGRIALAGGLIDSNYTPFASVYLFNPLGAVPARSRSYMAGLIVGILAAGLLVLLGWSIRKRRKSARPEVPADSAETEQKELRDKELFAKVEALMQKGLFQKKGLSTADLATTLGTNTKYISSCLKFGANSPFIDYVNGYRIRYAKKMMLENRNVRMSEVAEASGFASESSFYRNFKSATGLTPSEWQARQ